uniref:Pentatricopeptide repeat-containing protein n=1 Tax=Cucumis sativus TaxID=3659 RepID=A0A0A0L7I1_CUCSA
MPSLFLIKFPNPTPVSATSFCENYHEKMRAEGLSLDRFCFPPLLKAASRNLSLRTGMEIHGLASKLGFGSDPFVETGLVRMYAASGRIMEAGLVFDKMSHKDVVTTD